MSCESANQLGIRIAAFEERMGACLKEFKASEHSSAESETAQREAQQEGLRKLQEEHAQTTAAQVRRFEQTRDGIAKTLQRRTRRVWQAHERVRSRITQERQALTEAGQKELKEAEKGIFAEEEKVLAQVTQDHNALLEEIAALKEKATGLLARVKKMGAAVGEDFEEPENTAPTPEPATTRAGLDQMIQRLSAVAIACNGLDDSFLAGLSKRRRTVMAFVLLAAIHVGILVLLVQKDQPLIRYMILAGSCAGTSLLLLLITGAVRPRVARTLQGLHGDVKGALHKQGTLDQQERERFWAHSKQLVDQRIATLSAVGKKIQERESAPVKANDAAMASCKGRHQRLKDRIQAWGERKRAELDRQNQQEQQRLLTARENAEQGLRSQLEAAKAQTSAVKAKVNAEVESTWKVTLDEFLKFGQVSLADSLKRQPAWEQQAPQGASPTFPSDVRIGTLELPLRKLNVQDDDTYRLPDQTLALPLALTFPNGGSLVVQAGGPQRDKALEILFHTTLRKLAAFPPNMVRLTILDPVGLGQAFSALMQLADYDEALIGGKIWSDSGHIEKRLAEKTEHIEGVIQNYLRNRYNTLDEYNRDAGEMKEAYHFLLIADFPTGLSDLALERLASIASSGPRCGVHLLIYHDSRVKWPASVDLAQLKRHGVVIQGTSNGFVAQHEGLGQCRFLPEKPPEMPEVNRFLERVGKQAMEAKRVELSFSTTAPKPAEYWSRTTEQSFKVPIGRSGAVRTQELELGRGTAQHALIAGRTGSGKSTLFHVLITNTALWYSPREIEFYLIDFKKGVEFKVYATHSMPHARVVAIESDREFGLSVLKRLDRELDRRGELFRRVGVQDLGSYRKSNPTEQLPRTLLVVDEFQEFFTEDDGVAQEAALLLDRFVRQGRAFGLHIILGSQTLSGVYTLAKSTLGQMGVRIALQCNESDSYLILSEDNAAARLLSRPGEAIYNDMSGLVEGNVPFQIVWLNGEQEADYLAQIAEKSRDSGETGRRESVTFEGNAPARLEQNRLLNACLKENSPAEKGALPVWLGEPNAIKDPTEVRFAGGGGSHLLMIGQRKDAVLGMTSSMVFSLAARLGPERLRVLLLDGSGADEEFGKQLQRLADTLPHDIAIVPHRDLGTMIGDLDRQISADPEDRAAPPRHTFLFVLGLHRFKALRQEDDFALTSSRDEEASVGNAFANILREGPEHRIHTVVWCDTLANTNRALSRKTMREFDQRVLFQMSAADSSELIDSPAANKLGLHGALLFIESDGILEKFRPYALPEERWLKATGAILHARATQGAQSEIKG